MTARPTLSRWILLCATALVLIQLAAMAHLAAAPHGVCREHGVVVDLDAAPAQVSGVTLPALPGVGRAPAPEVRVGTHAHCPALWVMRAARSEVRSSWALGLRQGEVGRPRAPESVPALAGCALRCAPKQSPPV